MSEKRMRYYTFLFMWLILMLSGCLAQQSPKSEPDANTYSDNAQPNSPDSLKPQFIPDTAIGQISLLNAENVDSYLGKDIMDRLVFTELPSSHVLSKDKRQCLRVYFHPGGSKKEFSEFEVAFTESPETNVYVTTSREFETESNIKLGVGLITLLNLKGQPDSISYNETTTFHYRVDESENPPLLSKYNMPIYYADYTFKNDYLIRFRFGFEYP